MEERVFKINSEDIDTTKKYILYCMESSQRIDYNYALYFAVKLADKLNKPVITVFNITDSYNYSNVRYYKFMIEGILKLREDFKKLGIKFVINKNRYTEGCKKFIIFHFFGTLFGK
ncbi:MAG: deoxyribodipyrimidine photo-lyase [Hydrogenothermaceae bacterium]